MRFDTNNIDAVYEWCDWLFSNSIEKDTYVGKYEGCSANLYPKDGRPTPAEEPYHYGQVSIVVPYDLGINETEIREAFNFDGYLEGDLFFDHLEKNEKVPSYYDVEETEYDISARYNGLMVTVVFHYIPGGLW